jgi:ubiquinone/menaquinone biosynthesis C-methylase UbiE
MLNGIYINLNLKKTNNLQKKQTVMIKHYAPINEIIDYLKSKHLNKKRILEIGPGEIPFPLATYFIDHRPLAPNVIVLDVCNERFPFEDQFFDFVYARHVLEDVQNPTAVFKELVRVGKTGYIETPSVMAEITQCIDASNPHYKGYIHHRYIFWNYNDTLMCIPKYPVIEHIPTLNVEHLLKDKYNWNNYYAWDQNEKAKIKELKLDIDYNIFTEYLPIINKSVSYSITNSQNFKNIVRSNVQDKQDRNIL